MARRLSREEILAQIPAATVRGETQRGAGMAAHSIRYERAQRRFVLELTNGVQLRVPVASLLALNGATDAQLAKAKLSSSGSGIHIDALDADFSVPGIIQASVGRSLAARAFAASGGSARSEAKVLAARANGAKGGRPRQVVREAPVDQGYRVAAHRGEIGKAAKTASAASAHKSVTKRSHKRKGT
ncbi:MAG: DUF2442 domain-containing protein [Gemmatimonadota bacterium]|nr:DUF2442 domain-containing protein [Gemmatimonadota bacterium]